MKQKKVNQLNVDYQLFYNTLFHREYNARDDYIRWKKKEFSFCDYPFIILPEDKSKLLSYDALVLQQELTVQTPLIFSIRRDYLLQDSLDSIIASSYEPERLLSELHIKFDGEDGIDEGGVKKEWFQLLICEIFNLDYGMFIEVKGSNVFWFNHMCDQYNDYTLLGAIMGLALYNRVILDIRFPLVVYKKILGVSYNLEDLRGINEGLYNGLIKLLEYEGDVSEFGIYFEIMLDHYGEKYAYPLAENGNNLLVTNENKELYVNACAQYILDGSIENQYQKFFEGFMKVCGSCQCLYLCNPEELELLLVGSENLNFEDLKIGCIYDNYSINDITIIHFWEVVNEFTIQEKKEFLSFVSGSDRSPIGGLTNLKLIISKNSNLEQLPSSHTCFNHLILPSYIEKEDLKKKLLFAIKNTIGFYLK
eukprot:TRINITY_DN11637_c0_g1_i1.p1 TRINITY_DN11637_c0_g1~~TRINITY_DN11637_c0_g1_i1.p1  ORF type:complete len:421 (+),score=88.38 TRINITY_DN11637_c0_g1_i1:913-2175(+)